MKVVLDLSELGSVTPTIRKKEFARLPPTAVLYLAKNPKPGFWTAKNRSLDANKTVRTLRQVSRFWLYAHLLVLLDSLSFLNTVESVPVHSV